METDDKQCFQPDITDIRIGYECELLMNMNVDILKSTNLSPEYKPFVFEKWKMGILDDVFSSIRTQYLTKEQIEAEGWTVDKRSDELFSRKDNHHFYKGNLSLSLFIGYLKDEIIWYSISIYNSEGTLFKGSCKDINTFRYICKLIENY